MFICKSFLGKAYSDLLMKPHLMALRMENLKVSALGYIFEGEMFLLLAAHSIYHQVVETNTLPRTFFNKKKHTHI